MIARKHEIALQINPGSRGAPDEVAAAKVTDQIRRLLQEHFPGLRFEISSGTKFFSDGI
jgi:hypothetical protein